MLKHWEAVGWEIVITAEAIACLLTNDLPLCDRQRNSESLVDQALEKTVNETVILSVRLTPADPVGSLQSLQQLDHFLISASSSLLLPACRTAAAASGILLLPLPVCFFTLVAAAAAACARLRGVCFFFAKKISVLD